MKRAGFNISSILLFVLLLPTCSKKIIKQPNAALKEEGPYKVFFDSLHLENLSDTILIYNQTRIPGCGTARVMDTRSAESSCEDRYYAKYGDVLSDTSAFASFQKKHQVVIYWVDRGNEGELFRITDTAVEKNTAYKEHLKKTKSVLWFSEFPSCPDTVVIQAEISKNGNVSTTAYKLVKEGSWEVKQIKKIL